LYEKKRQEKKRKDSFRSCTILTSRALNHHQRLSSTFHDLKSLRFVLFPQSAIIATPKH